MMRKQIQQYIAEEDHNQPYTDTALAKKFLVSREYVTSLRKELKIQDSRERKQAYIYEEMQRMMQRNKAYSKQEMQETLRKKGYSLSIYLLNKYIKTAHMRQDPAEDLACAERDEEEGTEQDAFANLVGVGGSLNPLIQQAKATMLYPPHGLHCLIVGETGVGKSELVEAMYRFALKARSLPDNAPFHVLNCADYAENSQLLITQLFGAVKGAYTGAVTDRKGLIEQTDGGILFLDEVHRLSAEGQEMLFHLIDKGSYRRLGETYAARQANVQLIAATTENIETALLATFKRRIPMLIHLPPLLDRPLTERLQLIQRFFSYESSRMNAKLEVSLDVIKAFLLYDCKGNIGQLRSDIQVICAKSFLNYVTKKEDAVKVDLSGLSLYVKKGLLKIQSQRQALESLVWKDFLFHPKQCQVPTLLEEDVYSFPKEFYGSIEKLHMNCMQKGMNEQQVKELVGDEIKRNLQRVMVHVKHRLAPLSLQEVAKVIGDEAIYLAQEVLKIAEAELGKLDESLVYCLAIHLNATFARLNQGKKIINPNLEDVKRKFKQEYAVAEKMVALIKKRCQMDLPEDETSYIALYLHGNEKEEEGNVGVVVATHGNVGGSMLEIANKLLNMTHGKPFNMSFDEKPGAALERLSAVVRHADEGKGVLILADLGSLLTFGEMIQVRTKIRVETMDRVDTVMVIEALRRSVLPGSNLANVVQGIESLNYLSPKNHIKTSLLLRKKAILTICFTGEGVALYCKEQLKKLFGEELHEVVYLHVGIIGSQDIDQQIENFSMQYDIVAVVGSVDPKLRGIPYFSVNMLLSKEGKEQLAELLAHSMRRPMPIEEKVNAVPQVIQRVKILLLGKAYDTKTKVLKKMCQLLINENYVKEGYEKAVLEREKMGAYLIHQTVALPHADSSYVYTSAILFAKTEKPILWAGKKRTQFICLLALDMNGKDDIRYLYQHFQSDEVIARLKTAVTEDDVRKVLLYRENVQKTAHLN
ncbi:sigma 54-interacting transcriptional regulator [Anaerosinus massiliensis]|uniref:sigma 54-interacting transcriptional regulator n=1 Tax=Massilibacillus massiliensis TaxID=1806837 RepID=UPI0018FE424F|nr:sigma 54-interacting transcriptional regulator [Massilibacillus massiliensis]